MVGSEEVRPFEVKIPEEALVDLQSRLAASRWIDDPYEGDWDCGAPLPFVKNLCAYWQEQFDWRALEAKINRFENVRTDVDGLALHCLHHRSTRADATAIVLLHGWPTSFLEFLHLCEPLAQPGQDEPAFHVIVPSLPGYGFSATRKGIGPQEAAGLIAEMVRRLGYEKYMVQGGDWGSMVATEMARQFPENVIGLHLNCVNGAPPPDADVSALPAQEQEWAGELGNYLTYPHLILQGQKPASIAHALNDSPAGLAAWIGEKLHDWVEDGEAVSFDQMLETISLYWFTKTIASSSLFYYEVARRPPAERYVTVPTAGAIFPKEVAKLPRSWAERIYNITHWRVYDRGGHFPSTEVPELFLSDIRSFARTLS